MVRNEQRYVPASTTSTVDGLVAAIRIPASTGPAICVSWFAPLSAAFADATRRSSSPTTSGTTRREDEKYGAVKQPTANDAASRAGKDRCPVQCRIGITSISGPRAASETSIVRFAPSRAIREPAGIPSSPTGAISAARTQPIFPVEPVVARTNQGRAT